MSRKSSWWLRPQRKGASNRAALNESKYFMEHNKVLRERIKELAAENAKLREEVEQWHRLTAGIELPEYPITEFKPKDLERENAKLWELVRQMHPRAKAFLQLGVQLGCNDTLSYDWELQMRELGIEVC